VDDTGGLEYNAAAGELNDIEFSESAGTTTITDTAAVIVAGPGCDQVGEHQATCSGADRALVRLGDRGDRALVVEISNGFGILIHGEGGDDLVSLCAECTGVLTGDSGGDTLEGGEVGSGLYGGNGPDTLTGGASYDGINAGGGRDTIDAGAQADSISPGSGDDSVDGGPGRDFVAFNLRGRGVVADLRLGTATGQGTKTLAHIEDVIGTYRRDRFYGNGASNMFSAVGGEDVLVGRGGRDSLFGDLGSDRLFGGPGHDRLAGNRGADRLLGGSYGDLLLPGQGEDLVAGGGGSDEFFTRDGFRDVLWGGGGDDSARIDPGLDRTHSIATFL
jgi:Ca2+-binding RTX toxin-like protein